MKKTETRKSISCVLALFLALMMLASLFYIAKETGHDCTGEACPVCVCIHQAEQNIRNLGTGVTAAIMVSMIVFSVLRFTADRSFLISSSTPVSEKVRMNN